jgi:hypothetical protein
LFSSADADQTIIEAASINKTKQFVLMTLP